MALGWPLVGLSGLGVRVVVEGSFWSWRWGGPWGLFRVWASGLALVACSCLGIEVVDGAFFLVLALGWSLVTQFPGFDFGWWL